MTDPETEITMKTTPRPARLAYELATLDRSTRETETIALTFTDDVKGSTTEGRALPHHAPRATYARTGGAA